MTKITISLFLLILISCTTRLVPVAEEVKVTPYQTAGVERFFLTDIPSWVHFSQNGKCYLNPYSRYLDFKAIHENYQLSFLEIVELQIQYNEKWLDYIAKNNSTSLSPQEEAQFFYETLERVRGGVKRLKFPLSKGQYKVFWREGKETQVFQENAVLMSLCKTTLELESLMEEKTDATYYPYLIGSDALTIFNDSNFEQNPYLSFPSESLFEKESVIESAEATLPSEFNQNFIKPITIKNKR